MLKNSKGLSLIELIIVVGIILTLIGIASVGILPQAANRSMLDTTVTTLIAEIRAQQMKAMIGDTEGRGATDSYGIYLNNDTYTLFHGESYNPSEPTNLELNLGENITVSEITFPSSVVIFDEGNGEVLNFSAGNNQITLQDTITGTEKTITINNFGVVTSVD